ncbi:DNA topoisomerase [Burkholderia cepacia]|uniref:DNA topoisomerase n=1 Tax=Burkholderia cepacia TaxID=292 RepID=UPI002AB6BED9|nr:DNA topoisomerase [Burkholderia cepacia]
MEFDLVIIAEKPSMARDIAKALGGKIEPKDGYSIVNGKIAVAHAVGHLIGLAPPETYQPALKINWSLSLLPVTPDKWQLKPHDETRNQLNVILKLIKNAKEVVHAGDAGREGQIIIDYILFIAKYSGPVQRLWLQGMTPEAIRRAFKAMKPNAQYKNLFHAGIARARCDWLPGMNITMARTEAESYKPGITTRETWHFGRVKTWVLFIIAERERAIAAFVSQPYYLIKATVAVQGGTFDALFSPPEGAAYLSPEKRIIDKKAADAIAAKVSGKTGVIAECIITPDKRDAPPLPLKLGSLQKLANRELGLSPKETLTVAQSLYEKHKLISYPRTDFAHMPEEEHAIAQKFIDAARSNLGQHWDYPGEPDYALKSSAWNSSEIGDHFGLRPTEVRDYDVSTLSKSELAIYKLIVRYFLAQFYPAYRYDSTAVRVEIEGESFNASGTTPKDLGWKVLFPAKRASDPNDPKLPTIVKGESAVAREVNTHAEKTQAPPHIDGGGIIDIMETAWKYVRDPVLREELKGKGIGTSATRAPIVDELLNQGYLEEITEKRRKHYNVTQRGLRNLELAPPELKTADWTAYYEHQFSKVEKGEITHDAVVAEMAAYVTKVVTAIRDGAPPERAPVACEKCGKPMSRRIGKNGPFLSCSGFPACKHAIELAA